MPIRFRCVYCDKLLGIARRKAGAVVNCPQCGQPLIVPTPEAEPAAVTSPVAPSAPGKLFERDDFEAILQGDVTLRTSAEAPPKRSRTGRRAEPAPLPPRPFAVEQSLPAPHDATPAEAPARPRPAPGRVVLSTGMIVVLLVAAFVLIVGAFGAGVLVGRMLH
jgi:phage FluMu protein Com